MIAQLNLAESWWSQGREEYLYCHQGVWPGWLSMIWGQTHDRVQPGCWVRLSLALHELAPRERGKPPRSWHPCQELYNMLKSVGILEGLTTANSCPQGARQHAELWAWPLVWRNTKKSCILAPGAALSMQEKGRLTFCLGGSPREMRASSLQGRLNSYDRDMDCVPLSFCSNFMIQSSQCSCKSIPTHLEEIEGQRGWIICLGRLWVRGAWLPRHTYLSFSQNHTASFGLKCMSPLAFSRPTAFKWHPHLPPTPPMSYLSSPANTDYPSHPTHTNTDSHSP